MNEIDDLMREIETPDVDVADDVSRGERALRRRHWWQVSGAAVSVVAVVALAVVLEGGGAGSGSAAPGLAAQPSTSAHASTHPRAHRTHHPRVGTPPARIRRIRDHMRHLMDSPGSEAILVRYRNVLAEHLDPTGTDLRLAQNEQGGGDSFGTKLDWKDGGMLEIVVGGGFAAAGGFYDLESAGMQDTTYAGQPARVSTAGPDLVVSVRHDDGTVVTLIAGTEFGNNGTSTPSLGLTQHQLLDAAADSRLQLPPYLR
jgi:hypothetical protein